MDLKAKGKQISDVSVERHVERFDVPESLPKSGCCWPFLHLQRPQDVDEVALRLVENALL